MDRGSLKTVRHDLSWKIVRRSFPKWNISARTSWKRATISDTDLSIGSFFIDMREVSVCSKFVVAS